MDNNSTHLDFKDMVNFGSFYTPAKYVKIIGNWLLEEGMNQEWIFFDPSCGYGSFFRLQNIFPNNKYIGNDIDNTALLRARLNFPNVKFYNFNIFEKFQRENFNIKKNDKLIVVGNPPYNDTTSQIRQDMKTEQFTINKKIKSNDLGIVSLLAYNEMKAEIVVVLHPLSYLIKKTNFNRGKEFFSNYKLVRHIIFSSQEFTGTSKSMGFPIIVAMYIRNQSNGLCYEEVLNTLFKTIEGNVFKISDRDYIGNYAFKYPSNSRYKPEILFYTMRDINALKRSRTFISERSSNAVDVAPSKLKYYCYVDCFKMFANTPYFLGNLDIPFINKDFSLIEKEVVQISQNAHKDIFKRAVQPSQESILKVKQYIEKVVSFY